MITHTMGDLQALIGPLLGVDGVGAGYRRPAMLRANPG